MREQISKHEGAGGKLVVWVFLCATAVVLATYVGAAWIYCNPIKTGQFFCSRFGGFWWFFNNNIRASLFAGFLSVGGFLLSLKTFIIVNMKRDVFDTEKYKRKWEDQSKLSDVGRRYDPLRELSDVLFAAILTSIVTAVAQITIGLYESFWTAFVCLWMAVFATSLLITCLVLIKANINTMFSFLDD